MAHLLRASAAETSAGVAVLSACLRYWAEGAVDRVKPTNKSLTIVGLTTNAAGDCAFAIVANVMIDASVNVVPTLEDV